MLTRAATLKLAVVFHVLRLKEIGPRMTLTLTKITEGFCKGDVLYHKFDTLTDEQKVEITKRKEERK